jgi:hypothetical protein
MGMILNDTLGWIKRNMRNMNENEKKKMLTEIKSIQGLLEKELKLKGVS